MAKTKLEIISDITNYFKSIPFRKAVGSALDTGQLTSAGTGV